MREEEDIATLSQNTILCNASQNSVTSLVTGIVMFMSAEIMLVELFSVFVFYVTEFNRKQQFHGSHDSILHGREP